MTTYLDNATTTTLDPRVLEVMLEAFGPDVGDPDSRTHAFGRRARELVDRARRQVAELVSARRSEVIFTSGGTEAANLGVLGLGPRAAQEGRMHVVSALNEHSAVLEPLRVLEEQGFEVTRLSPGRGGWVEPEKLARALRPDTFLVSLMHVNDVTGVINPLVDYAEVLQDHEAWFHTDAAQGFGKDIKALRNPRIDLISVSGHKIHAPAGVGALIARRRDRTPPPLAPLTYGGGQELDIRPGALPVPLIAALGKAAELAGQDADERHERAREFEELLIGALAPLQPVIHGDPERKLPHILCLSVPGLSSSELVTVWEPWIAIAGSEDPERPWPPAYGLSAMGLTDVETRGAVRLSWSHLTEFPDVQNLVGAFTG